jgi:alpha-L-rhamnosidase
MWFFLGDWITPHGSESDPKSAENILFNNCYLYYITQITANISQIIGMNNDTAPLRNTAMKLFASINTVYYNNAGYYVDLLQSHLTMPLATGVVPPNDKILVSQNLETAIVVTKNGHLDTGLTGTYFMTKFLQENYRNDLVFTYANQTTFPSYGWFLVQGYTTWPEDWAIRDAPEESIMHGCYNSIGMWFMKGVLGIQQSPVVGFPSPMAGKSKSTILIRSGFDCGDVTSSKGSLNTIFGNVTSSWSFTGKSELQHNVTIPVNGVALVQLPGTSLNRITESGQSVNGAVGVSFLGTEKQHIYTMFNFQVVSGTYYFISLM